MLTDNMAKMQMALEASEIVQNEKGERIALPSNDGKRTDDCIKCYIKDMFYWSTAAIQQQIFVNGQPFEEWLDITTLEWYKFHQTE